MPSRYQIDQTAPVLAYLLRAMVRRIDRRAMPADRARNLETEVNENLHPLVVSTRNTQQFVRAFATRFDINLTGGTYAGGDGRDHMAAPLYLLVPRGYVEHAGLPEMEHAKASDRPDCACLRWDVACRAIDFDALRILVNDNPAQWATFAFTEEDPSDATLFDVPDPTHRDVAPFVAPLPGQTVSPRAHRAVWTLVSNLAHGGDYNSGNVTLLRRERAIDPTTGEQALVPLFSANATRGILRDIAGGLLCRSLGIASHELPPTVAHALFSGGTLEQGADNGTVDLGLRRRLRELVPMWDVFGGVWDKKQIMQGVLKMHDPIVVCRENAWRVYQFLVPEEGRATLPFEVFRGSLPRADDITQLRMGTRHAHRDLPEADGYQMIWNTEVLLAGTRICHSFQLQNLDGVNELARSFVAHILDEFRAVALTGASTARGMGQFAFDPYQPGAGEESLPSQAIYTAWMAEHADEVRAFLMSGGKGGGGAVPEAPKKTARGRGKKATEPAGEAPQDVEGL